MMIILFQSIITIKQAGFQSWHPVWNFCIIFLRHPPKSLIDLDFAFFGTKKHAFTGLLQTIL